MRTTESHASSDTFRLLRALTEAQQTISRQGERLIAAWDLGGSEFDVIATLGNTDGMRMCDLAQRTLNTKSNITRVIKDLASRGLVERRRNPDCEREVFVRLTDAGEELFVRTYPQVYEFTRELFDERLSPDEQRQLTGLLRRLAAPGEGCPATPIEAGG